MTPLDHAHASMEANVEDDTLRLQFYERLADAELFMLLEAEVTGDKINPMTFPVEDNAFVLVFDREERLSEFTGAPSPYVAMSGRKVVELLKDQDLGLGINLSVAPSSTLLPPDAIAWLARMLGERASEVDALPIEVSAPSGLPESVVVSLDKKLATAEGLAKSAYLVSVSYEGAGNSHMLAFVEPLEGAQNALTQAVQEALTFSGIDAGQLDVAFFDASDPICIKFASVGLRFDIPQPQTREHQQTAPGMDPDAPPILR